VGADWRRGKELKVQGRHWIPWSHFFYLILLICTFFLKLINLAKVLLTSLAI
jgi:hypothetical protein